MTMAGEKKTGLRPPSDEVMAIVDKHGLPGMTCPLCGDEMYLILYDIGVDQLVLSYTCGCAKWEMVEEELQLFSLGGG